MTHINNQSKAADGPQICTHDCEFVVHEMTLGGFEKPKICMADDFGQLPQFLSGSKQNKKRSLFSSD